MTTTTYADTRDEATRRMPWNVMGQALSVKATSSLDRALAETGLDYDVRLAPVVAYDKAADEALPFATFHDAPDYRAVIRPMPDGTEKVIGVTGKRFRPIQNRDAFAVADDLIALHGARIDGLADFRSGAASLLVMDLAQPVELRRPDGGVDRIDLDLMIRNAHDGSAALTFALIGMRIACTNAVQAALRTAKRTWKISHTPNAENRLALATQAIKLAVGYRAEFATAAQAMLDQPLVDAEFAKIVQALFPADPDAEGAVAERKRERQAEILGLYATSPTLEGIRGTRWGGYNAITEWLDHYRPVKGQADVARAEGALEGPYVRMKASVWERFAVTV